MTHPNGTLIDLSHGGYQASIASVGAAVRRLEFDGRPLIVPFAAEELRPVYRGALLAPWPNRVVDGRYAFDGAEYELPINEPARNHALHGLVHWLDFDVTRRTASQAQPRGVITAQSGYPFTVALEVTFELTDHGLVTTVRASNQSPAPAPYGVAAHPYLVAGTPPIDAAFLHLPAGEVLAAEGPRLLPGAVQAVAGVDDGALDFRARRRIGDTFIDHAYTGLDVDEDGRCTVAITADDGAGAYLHWDGRQLPWVQVHTADRPEPQWHRAGLAVEPMTCPPDAFNTGVDLITLEPGDGHTASWTIGAITS